GDTAAELLRPFPRARRLPERESLSRLQCCRGLSESAAQQDRPVAIGSTSQSVAGSFRRAAQDFAKSIRQPDAASLGEARRLCRCWFQKARLVDRRHAFAIHRTL